MTSETWSDASRIGYETTTGGVVEARAVSRTARTWFALCTSITWAGIGVCGLLFHLGVLEFATSAKIGLYATSVWLNAWLLAWVAATREPRTRSQLMHDCIVLWMASYALTNLVWEVPWVILSPHVFEGIDTLADIEAQTGYMRESILHMYFWVLASFGSVDLRTVNGNGTFYSVECFAFANLAATFYFFHLNRKRSPYRYAIPVLGCGEPIAATFIFTFSEVFDGYVNMAGGIADTLLALVWTQYQYLLFPALFGVWAFRLLQEDLRKHHAGQAIS